MQYLSCRKNIVCLKNTVKQNICRVPGILTSACFIVFKRQLKIFVFEMTMPSPKHAVFSQIRLSVPDTMDKEKYYHVKHYCTHISPRKNHLMQKTAML
jgi:hypothetical protein